MLMPRNLSVLRGLLFSGSDFSRQDAKAQSSKTFLEFLLAWRPSRLVR
jgi:hypothetical protein